MQNLIEVTDLSIGFRNPLQSGINFSIEEGEILFVRGKNGTGKSTLIKTLCGELNALSGKVDWRVDNQQISVLPQVVSHEFPLSITLGEIISIFDPEDNIRRLLPENLHSRRFNDASGGERQKALILTRLRRETSFLILDEPFNHLDQTAVKEMMKFISKLVQDQVIKGVILISHVDVDFESDKIKEVVLS